MDDRWLTGWVGYDLQTLTQSYDDPVARYPPLGLRSTEETSQIMTILGHWKTCRENLVPKP